jgi:hypothetical protein
MYFSKRDHELLAFDGEHTTSGDNDLQSVYDKFFELHNSLYRRFRDHNYDLHPHWNHAALISSRSAACTGETTALALPYFRSKEQATLVERLMGRDGLDWQTDVEIYRHPVIELRLTPKHFAVELVLSPYAWWDQQNFIGKLAIARHRDTLRGIFQRMGGDFRFGFWDGIDLDDMHLTTQQLVRGNYLNDWMSTFCDGQDWLRLGTWYDVEDAALEPGRILSEVTQRIGALQSVYSFLLWTSNNDFHSFYRKINVRGTGLTHA